MAADSDVAAMAADAATVAGAVVVAAGVGSAVLVADAAARGGNPEEAQAIANFSRTLVTPVHQMTLVVHESSVSIADNEGGVLTLETTNEKISSRAENGLVKPTRKSRWDGNALVSEVEIENGPKFEQTYEVIADGSRLRISTTTQGSGSGDSNTRVVMHVYERSMP